MSIKKETFCVAPWYSIFLGSNGKIAPCCKFKKPSLPYQEIDQYFHSPQLAKLRQDLLSGIKNPGCVRCWEDEANGGDSLRLISNRTIGRATETPLMEQISIYFYPTFFLLQLNLTYMKPILHLVSDKNITSKYSFKFPGSCDRRPFCFF